MSNEQDKGLLVELAKEDDPSSDPSFFSFYRLEFSPTEKKVLLIAKALMEKHYLLNTESLYRQAVREIKDVAPETIRTAIKMLLSKNILFDGAAMTKDEVLGNETRHRIFEIIYRRPGIHYSGIKALAETDSRSLSFHLNVLGRFGFVRFEQMNNNKAYYEISSPRECDILFYYMQKEDARDIFKVVLEHESISVDDLFTFFEDSMSRQTLLRKIKILIENDLISGKFEASRPISLSIAPRYKSLIKAFFSRA